MSDAPKKKAAKKEYASITKGVMCPDCGNELRLVANATTLKCFNPNCDAYGAKFAFPQVEIKKA